MKALNLDSVLTPPKTLDKVKRVINVKPIITITITKVYLEEREELEEGEHLSHLQIWMIKRAPLHFIVDDES